MLIKDKSKRLGYHGDGKEVLQHPFFRDLDLENLYTRKMVPPFKPDFSAEQVDPRFFNTKTE